MQLFNQKTFLAAQAHCEQLKSFTWSTLPQAGVRHLADMVKGGQLEGELTAGQAAAVLRVADKLAPVFCAPLCRLADGCQYLVFKDGSLLYRNNSQDEVWAFAADFIADRLLAFNPDGDFEKLERALVDYVDRN